MEQVVQLDLDRADLPVRDVLLKFEGADGQKVGLTTNRWV
jgi:hypothetical protein